MSKLFVLLGSNTGDSLQVLRKACEELSIEIGSVTNISNIYLSEAWGIEDQPTFYNQVVQLSAINLDPTVILEKTQQIEQKLGRTYETRWSSRVIDIDILYLGDTVVSSEKLTIPHKYLPYRNFALVPLCEIAPDFVHPLLNKTNYELLQQSTDRLEVRLYEE